MIWGAMISNFQMCIAILIGNILIRETLNRHPTFWIVKKCVCVFLNKIKKKV